MMAETQIGLSKYRLDCMSTDGCAGSFGMDQKEIFLDKHSMTALDRIEQEAVLREAGIDNLETCPQCPFAAEYPPIDEDKEFRCLNPDCAVTSCRSCRKETHVPKTCAEAALDNGHSARHEIEEAMSAALIRTCNKCSAPFIKENGCNKMTCTKCRNIQCYVCSKSCQYNHFNDTSRGGKTGNCPLFDDGYGVEKRHQDEVRAAEEQARKTALEKHPEVQADLLEFQLSDKVKKDEEEKASAHQR
jgi:TRIAD3 protein (E3 ubiquitin-protein ligase RNF216)